MDWIDQLPDAGRWQDRFALENWRSRLTRLSPDQERAFQEWAARTGAPITDDYDMRGYWLHGAQGSGLNANDHMVHYPDTYKTPLHQSFSAESVYARPDSGAPTWNDRDQLVLPDGTVLYDERVANRPN